MLRPGQVVASPAGVGRILHLGIPVRNGQVVVLVGTRGHLLNMAEIQLVDAVESNFQDGEDMPEIAQNGS